MEVEARRSPVGAALAQVKGRLHQGKDQCRRAEAQTKRLMKVLRTIFVIVKKSLDDPDGWLQGLIF